MAAPLPPIAIPVICDTPNKIALKGVMFADVCTLAHVGIGLTQSEDNEVDCSKMIENPSSCRKIARAGSVCHSPYKREREKESQSSCYLRGKVRLAIHECREEVGVRG